MNKKTLGILLVLISTIGFGLMPTFALFAYQEEVSVTTLLFIRFALASVIIFIYMAATRTTSFKLTRKELFNLFLLGGVCYSLQAGLYFSSVQYIPSSLAALLLYTYPMIVALLGFIFNKEKPSTATIMAMIISFKGLILVLGASFSSVNFVGIALTLAAAVVYAVYIMLSSKVLKSVSPVTASGFIFFFASLSLLVNGLITNSINFNFNPDAWLYLGGLILFSTIIASLFFLKGIKLLGSTNTSILSMTEPLFCVIFAIMFFHEGLSTLQIIGSVLVLAGAFMVIISNSKKEKKAVTESV